MSENSRDSITIHNTRLDSNFTQVINSTWADENLSFKAKGVLIYILTRPPNWVVHPWQLANLYKGDGNGNGMEAIRVAVKELRDLGYLKYSKFRNVKGHWQHRYDAFPMPYDKFKIMFPQQDNPCVEKPDTEKPNTENASVLIKNELTKNELTKNDKERSKDHIAQTAKKRLHYEFSFSYENSCFEGIEQKDLDSWKELYPSVDISREIKLMEQWCIANPKKSKSKKKWRQFINVWLSNTNEKNINKEAYRSNSGTVAKNLKKSESEREGVWVGGVRIK